MKKRKPPVLLLSVLLVLVGVVVVFGMIRNHAMAGPGDAQVTGDAQQAPSADDVASKAGTEAQKVNHDSKMTPYRPNGGGPSIAVESATPHIMPPKPNPNGTTNSQWYDK